MLMTGIVFVGTTTLPKATNGGGCSNSYFLALGVLLLFHGLLLTVTYPYRMQNATEQTSDSNQIVPDDEGMTLEPIKPIFKS